MGKRDHHCLFFSRVGWAKSYRMIDGSRKLVHDLLMLRLLQAVPGRIFKADWLYPFLI